MSEWTWKERLGFPPYASTIAIVACYAIALGVVVPAYAAVALRDCLATAPTPRFT